MAKRYEDRYGRGGYRRDRADDRGYMERAGDEVRSWLGDDEAQRRRYADEQRDRQHERTHDTDWNRRDWNRDRADWNRGEQRADWSRTTDYRRDDWNRSTNRQPEQWRAGSPENYSSYRDRNWTSSSANEWDRDQGVRSYEDAWRSNDRPAYESRTSRPFRDWSLDDGRTEFSSSRYGRGPKGYQRSDSRILEDVCDRLTYSEVDAENIEVRVEQGEVTLSGSVRERWDKRRAEDVVDDISGVRDVHNNIRVAREARGIGQSDMSVSDQPGTVLGVNPTSSSTITNAPPKGSTR
jgi:osmotically-inducible protein OsmY